MIAQPVNDNWANAIEINIPDGNMATGIFQGATVSLNDASNQTGEYLYDPTYPKTVWYKFSIPTHRSVRIKTLQPTEILNQNDAGFVVYKSTPTIPGEDDMAIFTPFLCLACYSENVCLERGEYYVQLVAKNGANSDVFIELDVAYTYPVSTTYEADQLENKHDLGTVTYNNSFSFNFDCLSLESTAEFSDLIGVDSLLFNKSIWFKFDTDDQIDLFAFDLYKYSSNEPYVIRIYEGEPVMADLDTEIPVYESVHNVIYSGYSHFLKCLLEPNTTYTVQLLGHENYTGSYNFRIYHLGEGQVTGAYPQEALWNPLNDFGTIIPQAPPGVTTELEDYFSCEALLTNDSIQCGTANAVDSVFYDPMIYDLTTWFTLSTTAESNATFRARTRRTPTCNSDYYNHGMRIRVWLQDPDNDCVNYNFPDDLYYDGQLNNDGQVILSCLPAGDYAIQLLGRSQLEGNVFHCSQSQFGSKVTLAATLAAIPTVEYGLTIPGDVDWINGSNPLAHDVLYVSDSARFSCTKTIIPDTSICNELVDRSIYRQVVIGDGDGDAVPDSGLLVVNSFRHYNALQNYLVKSVFYEGDASNLADIQGIDEWPEQISGLDPYEGCEMWNNQNNTNNSTYNTKIFCVKPGTYTLASVGDSTENGALSLPNFRFLKQQVTQFADYQNPENMGDIIAQGLSVTSQPDYFTCLDNPDTVGGVAPCTDYTKQLYREFYLSQDCRISVNEASAANPYTNMRLFQGRASDVGLDGVTLAPFHSTNCYSGHYNSSYSLPSCATVPAGWYTVVSYGFGPNYDNNYEFHEEHLTAYNSSYDQYNINKTSTVTVTADTTELPGPFYNHPYNPCVAEDTISYVNLATEDYPTGSTSYTLCMERFKFVTDTPYVNIPIIGCPDTERLAFYVFTTDDEYFTYISGISNFYKELYPLDVRTDSLLLPTTEPITTCDGYQNDLAICRLQPGTYTLVVYGTSSQNCNTTFTPVVRVAPVDISRFDFAAHAYDFDLIPGDNNFHGGKVGDVHPTNPNLLPSDDTFYCTTGAFADDPPTVCQGNDYPPVYPDSINNAYFNEPGSQYAHIARNLWYTFVVQGMGTATVKIQNLTGGGNPTFNIYRSDVDGNVDFSDLVGTAELDSTIDMGMTLIDDNVNYYCSSASSEVSFTFLPDICVEDTIKRRYFVVADITEQYNGRPNLQMDLQIKWNPILANPIEPLYDFYHTANVIGNDEIAPPYTEIPLEFDTFYTGGQGNMSCATGDITDQSVFGSCIPENQKSLWWKFILDEPGFLYLGVETDGYYGYYDRHLLEQVVPGDSIISPLGADGLLNLGEGSSASPTSGAPNYNWRRFCVDPGTYYFHVSRCAAVDTSDVRAHAYFAPISGDRCVDAVGTTAPTYGNYSVSVPILCHSMGDDFGEEGTNLSCLQGPEGYHSTWFQFSYTGPDLVDILFQLNLSQLSNYNGTQNVRYRLFYGDDCATMIEGLECSNNAFINNSVACISEDGGDFYVQVTYPENASGTLGFDFTVSPNSNPDCNPFNPTLLISDFITQMNCAGDSMIFTNYATSGSSLEYLWDFGWNGSTSNEVNPVFTYPADGTYDVTLSVINPILGDTASVTYPVDFDTSGSPLELGEDQTICIGETATLGGFISQATYEWSTGENTSEIAVTSSGEYWVDLELNGCSYSDTVEVTVVDLNFSLGNDEMICAGDTLELEYESNQTVEYNWSNGSDSTTTQITEAGAYWLEVSTGNCVARDTIIVSVLDLSFDLGNDTTICAGTGFDLNPTVQPGVSYDWSTGDNGSQIFVDQAGTIQLSISADGCEATDEIEVFELDLVLELGPDSTICLGDSAMLIPQTNAIVNYLWGNGDTSPTQTVSETGWYSLTVDSAACYTTDSVYVSTLDLNFELGSDTTLCAGTSLDIIPQVPANVDYLWSTGSTDSQITVTEADTYSLQIDSLHCSASRSMVVDVVDLSFTLGPDTSICDGSSITLNPDFPYQVNYLWNDGTTASQFTTDSAATYSLTVDTMGCIATNEIDVAIFYVDANVPDTTTGCLNDTVPVSITGADSLTWSGNVSDITILNNLDFQFHPDASGQYSWTAYENGCVQTGTMFFELVMPYVPDPVYTDHYCSNDGEIALPEIPFTTGDFYFDGDVISTLEITGLEAGAYQLEYHYTDTNTCGYSITLPFSISDTTTTEFTSSFPAICLDSNPVELESFVNIPGGTFSVNYFPSPDTLLGITEFNPAFVPDDAVLPYGFPLTYTFTNASNCTSIIEDEIVVHPDPQIDISVVNTCLNESVEIVNGTSVSGSDIEIYAWDFENWGISDQAVPLDISYAQQGVYAAILTVTSEIGCSSVDTVDFEIYPLPELQAESYGPFCLNDGELTMPEATPAGGTFTWDQNPVVSLNSYNIGAGDTTLIYEFTDLNGCFNDLSIPFVINDTTTVFFTTDLPEICIDAEPVDLQPFLSTPDGTTSVAYDLNSWTTTDFFNTSEISAFGGSPLDVPVQFAYTNPDGCSSEIFENLRVHPLPVIDISVPDICGNEALNILNSSFVNGSTIITTDWNIEGAGTFDTFQVPQLWFESTGPHTYSLSLESSFGCSSAVNDSFEIHPVPQSQYDIIGQCNNEPVLFAASSEIESGSIDDYVWWIEGTENPGQADFSYEFPETGTYTTALTSVSEFGCRDTVYQTLEIYPAPESNILADDHCFENAVQISAEVTLSSGSVDNILWTSGSEFNHTGTDPFTHTFNTSGTHVITQQVISDMGCTTVTSTEVEVYPLPVPEFAMSDTAGCLNERFTFSSISFAHPPQNIDMTWWTFSSGEISMDTEGTITPSNPGYLSLNLTVVTDSGCTATLDAENILNVWPLPVAGFSVDPSNPDISDPTVHITDHSEGDVVDWFYDFQDGTTTENQEPSHTFSETGSYRVNQKVFNEFGCMDSTHHIVKVEGFLVYIPNAFTPNEDGVNEIFKPSIHGEAITAYEFVIVNRYGQEVFRSTDPEYGWNGSGAPGSDYYGTVEVYTYYLRLVGEYSFPIEYKGSVTLVR